MSTQLKRVKYDVIFAALEGELACGDQYLVKELTNSTLLAVVDGLGHGEEAAFAAKKAVQTLDANADDSVETLVKLCNQALLDTRGAAMTVVKIDATYNLTYLAIGNVLGVHWKIDENAKLKHASILLKPGIVGGNRIPVLLQAKEIKLAPGDIFILATDGIKNQFESEPPKMASPETIAKQIFNTYRNPKDDGLVLVAQFL